MLVENRLANLEGVDEPERLLASLAEDESVAGLLVEKLGLLASGVFGLDASDFFP